MLFSLYFVPTGIGGYFFVPSYPRFLRIFAKNISRYGRYDELYASRFR